MQRIFLSLAAVAVVLLVVNAVIGLLGGDFNAATHKYVDAKEKWVTLEKNRESDPTARAEAKTLRDQTRDEQKKLEPAMTFHSLFGLAAALVTVLVNSISITYFVGTSRWSKEVVDAYHLDTNLAAESARIKRRSFPWSVGGMLMILTMVTLGAAADPRGMNHVHSQDWVVIHYVVALAGIAGIVYAFLRQAQCLSAHFALIETIMHEVRRVREERGLEVEAAA